MQGGGGGKEKDNYKKRKKKDLQTSRFAFTTEASPTAVFRGVQPSCCDGHILGDQTKQLFTDMLPLCLWWPRLTYISDRKLATAMMATCLVTKRKHVYCFATCLG